MRWERIWVWIAILINLVFALALLIQAWPRPATPQEIDREMERADAKELPERPRPLPIVLPPPPARQPMVAPAVAAPAISEQPLAETPLGVVAAAPAEPLSVPVVDREAPVVDPGPEKITHIEAGGLAESALHYVVPNGGATSLWVTDDPEPRIQIAAWASSNRLGIPGGRAALIEHLRSGDGRRAPIAAGALKRIRAPDIVATNDGFELIGET